jgi:diguanylate cyclase (GGDEF)-like protein
MTPELANALICHFAKKYLADILPNDIFATVDSSPLDDNAINIIDDWDGKVSMLNHWEQAATADPKKQEHINSLNMLKQALLDNRKVWLSYEERGKKFKFNLFGLVMRDQQFFIVGSYWEHQEPFLLSVRKITSIALIDEDALKPDAGFKGIQAYASHYLNAIQEDIIETLEVEFPIHLLSYVQTYPLHCDKLPEIDKDGDYFTLRAQNVPNSPRLQQWLSSFYDDAHIIQPIELRKTISRSFIDKLTNLYNRHYFERLFQREIQRYCRDTTYCFSILALDINHFKNIDESFDYDEDDRVLRLVAEELRDYDAIRYGDEEFYVLLAETNAQGAYGVAERIRHAIVAAELTIDNKTAKLTISIGVAGFPEHLPAKSACSSTNSKLDVNAAMGSILNQADTALYEAKKAGRNRCVMATGLEKTSAGLMKRYMPNFLKKQLKLM